MTSHMPAHTYHLQQHKFVVELSYLGDIVWYFKVGASTHISLHIRIDMYMCTYVVNIWVCMVYIVAYIYIAYMYMCV